MGITTKPGIKKIAAEYLQEEANDKDHQDASIQRQAVEALRIAKARHTSCRGVLGQLPVAGNRFEFECCDCHEVVAVSDMEATCF